MPGAFVVDTRKEAMQIQHGSRLVLNYDKKLWEAAKSDRSGIYLFALLPIIIFFLGLNILFFGKTTDASKG